VVQDAAQRSLTAAAPSQRRPVRAVAVLLLLALALPGPTATSPLGLPSIFAGADPPAAVAPVVSDAAALEGALNAAQLTRSAARYRGLSTVERVGIDALLATTDQAAQGYLLKAFAAGHTVAELSEFAHAIAGRDRGWLRTRLSPVDPRQTGPVHYRGYLVRQYDDTSCGSTAIVVAHAMADPIYAYQLTTGGRPGTAEESGDAFIARLRAEERRVRGTTNMLWPPVVGTPPWGVRDQMNQQAVGIGGLYRWNVIQEWATGAADAVIRQAMLAVDQGYPVPMLIGDAIPRHYVLLVHRDVAGALFYEPTSGRIERIGEQSLRRRDFSVLGYPHIQGVVLPR